MKTLKSFIEKSHIEPELIRAVVRQCGGWSHFKTNAENINRCGASGGFHGFIYYSETSSFYRRNRPAIVKSLSSLALDLGESMLSMVQGFNVIKDNFTQDEIGRVLYGTKSQAKDLYQIENVLSWYALEEVSRSYTDQLET